MKILSESIKKFERGKIAQHDDLILVGEIQIQARC
jgi:hypothetical protein